MARRDEAERWAGDLQTLGLGTDEARAYLQLLGGSKTVSALGRELRISRPRMDEILDRLTSQGLVIHHPGRVARFTVTPVDVALKRLIQKREAALERSRSVAAELARLWEAQAGETRPERYLEVTVGEESVLALTWRAEASARQEIIGFVRGPTFSLDNPGEEEALERGVSNRWLWDKEFIEEPRMLEVAREYAARGENIRIVADLPAKLIVVDRKMAVILVKEESVRESVVVGMMTRYPELVATIYRLFTLLWESGMPLASATTVANQPELDRDLVDCLVVGMSDRSIGRQLGVSERTVTRRIAQLLSELGVDTRFQAGFRLGQMTSRPGPALPTRH